MSRALFDAVQPHMVDPTGNVRTWFTEPAGMLNRLAAGTFIDVDVAVHISTAVNAAMRTRFAKAARFYYIHEFPGASGYSTHARQILTNWGVEVASSIERLVCVPPPMNNVFKMGISTAAMTLRTVGVEIEVVDSLDGVLARYKLRPA